MPALTASSSELPKGESFLSYVAPLAFGTCLAGVLAMVIAVPLAVSARWLTWANRGLQGAVGLATIAIGVTTIVEKVLA